MAHTKRLIAKTVAEEPRSGVSKDEGKETLRLIAPWTCESCHAGLAQT